MGLHFFSATFFFLLLFGGGIVLPADAGPDEKPKAQATPTIPEGYEVIDSLLRPETDRKDLDKQLEAALGKEGAKRVLRWESFVWRFDWDPKKVKPGDHVRVYFPDVGPLSGDDVEVKVNGKVVWKAREGKLSKEIELPKREDGNKDPLLRIHVGSRTAVVWEGVTNIYVLRPRVKK